MSRQSFIGISRESTVGLPALPTDWPWPPPPRLPFWTRWRGGIRGWVYLHRPHVHLGPCDHSGCW